MISHDVPTDLPLTRLNSMANSRTGNVGENNFIFEYNDDEIEFDKEYTTIGEVLVLDDDDVDNVAANESFVIDCFEITAGWVPWRKDIVLKNATQRILKVEVQYPGVDYLMDAHTRY